ncbi:hypothetical protein [Glacieibacterium frigidum]|uniref:Uncharacterized protein n=1 Tax=Glacieibacterium frigidum TaxID=2593303 RepID=A0A552U860_9SPHN|nr:hypothetical protein [Glacieibacterium frigidum]TRW14408.1 hypothetical protein FMM06_11910 [Glacieibacterium frigidum]
MAAYAIEISASASSVAAPTTDDLFNLLAVAARAMHLQKLFVDGGEGHARVMAAALILASQVERDAGDITGSSGSRRLEYLPIALFRVGDGSDRSQRPVAASRIARPPASAGALLSVPRVVVCGQLPADSVGSNRHPLRRRTTRPVAETVAMALLAPTSNVIAGLAVRTLVGAARGKQRTLSS